MNDLIYFGLEDDSVKLEGVFKMELSLKYPSVQFKDAYDEIKGHRQSVDIEDVDENEYFAWVIGNGWINSSLNVQLLIMDSDRREEAEKVFALTKELYPLAFNETLED